MLLAGFAESVRGRWLDRGSSTARTGGRSPFITMFGSTIKRSRLLRLKESASRYDRQDCAGMPTLPTKSLFDKDFSLRSPFPRHVSKSPQIPADHSITSSLNETRSSNTARNDFSQIKRPIPVKPTSVFDLQLPQANAPQAPRTMTTFHVLAFHDFFR